MGTSLASGSSDQKVKEWELATGSCLNTFRAQDANPGDDVEVSCLAFTRDGTVLAAGGGQTQSGEVKLWNVEAGTELARLKGFGRTVTAIAFTADEKSLVTATAHKVVEFWDLATFKKIPG